MKALYPNKELDDDCRVKQDKMKTIEFVLLYIYFLSINNNAIDLRLENKNNELFLHDLLKYNAVE